MDTFLSLMVQYKNISVPKTQNLLLEPLPLDDWEVDPKLVVIKSSRSKTYASSGATKTFEINDGQSLDEDTN